MYHAAFMSRSSLEREDSEIKMTLIQQDLSSCLAKLNGKEACADLMDRVCMLREQALRRKNAHDIAGAKKCILDRRRAEAQLDKLRSSILVIESHASAIEGTEIDRSILDTLRASGDALKSLVSGIKSVEDVVSDAETQLETAAEITKVLASGSVSGMLNGMDTLSDDELERELNDLIGEEYSLPAVPVRIQHRRLASPDHTTNSMEQQIPVPV